jgi:hypothetical protein
MARKSARLISAIVLVFHLLIFFWGCGEKQLSSRELLERAKGQVEELAQKETPFKFSQELTMRVESGQDDLEQRIQLEGEMYFPLKQRYEYRESWSGTLLSSGREQVVTLSYITLDGGRTAFVRGTPLELLGQKGWVYYTPPEGESRYFDYGRIWGSLASGGGEVEDLGVEELGGRKCRQLRLSLSLSAMIENGMQGNPEILEKYKEIGQAEDFQGIEAVVWIDQQTYLLAKLESNMNLEKADTGGKVSIEMVMEFKEYGVALTLPIEAPAFYTQAR